MGRKKIEIKPLTDERNRNVTFLKRKAGLMKKAWELSVLCSADVSIVIFAPSGKCFEFTSVQDGKGLDGQIARYVDYEGSIERRRAPEFAAAAAQGDDDSGDEDVVNSKKPAAQGSLKGKEEWKEKTVLGGGGSTSKKPSGSSKRQRQASVSDGSHSRSRSKSPPNHYPHPHQQYSQAHPYGPGFGIPTAPPIRTTAEPSAIQYALSMNNNNTPAPQPSLNSLYNTYPPETTEPAWDSQTLARLAEFQLQQDHQRQQRALLERQRRQLMDLGVPTNGDPAFMEMIFGNGGGGQRPADPFLWPTTAQPQPQQQQQQRDEPHHAQPAIYARGQQSTPFTFPNRPYNEQTEHPPQQQQQQAAGPSDYWEGHEGKVET